MFYHGHAHLRIQIVQHRDHHTRFTTSYAGWDSGHCWDRTPRSVTEPNVDGWKRWCRSLFILYGLTSGQQWPPTQLALWATPPWLQGVRLRLRIGRTKATNLPNHRGSGMRGHAMSAPMKLIKKTSVI